MCDIKKEMLLLFCGADDQTCVCAHVCHGVHAEVRRQIVGVYSFLSPCGFWGLNSGCQSWQ